MKIALLCALLSVALSAVAQSQGCHTPHFKKKITIQSPTVFTGTLDDEKAASMPTKSIALTSLDKKTPQLSQVAVTDAHGAFRFDSVPAGKYAITFNFSGWMVKKSEVHCATNDACSIALVVKPAHYWCYGPPGSDMSPGIRGGGP